MMPIPRTLFDEDHEAFRNTVRRFMEQEVAPHHPRWEEQTHVDRDVWTKGGAAGLLCASMPEEYGGVGVDKRFSFKVMDECVQLHGGYGYMWDYPITRAWADARVQRIYGGTNETRRATDTGGPGQCLYRTRGGSHRGEGGGRTRTPRAQVGCGFLRLSG